MISNRSFYNSSQMPLIFSGFSNSVSSANFFMLLLTEHKSSHHRSPFNPPADITLLPELVIYSYIPFLTLYQLFIHLRIFCLMLCSLKILAKKSLSKISGKISSNWPVKHLLPCAFMHLLKVLSCLCGCASFYKGNVDSP